MSGFGSRTSAGAQSEAVELDYVFDFEASETVVYTGAGPFPGRVFVLHFWRAAKDRVMHLLGYEQEGHWRDPTLCMPLSHVRYYRVTHAPPHPRLPLDTTRTGHEEREDTTQHRKHAPPLEQLAYRVPLLELDHGIWELPTLKGKPIHMIDQARRFPKPPRPIVTRKHSTPPPLKKPIERTLEFVTMSTHFEHPAQAEKELAKVLAVLRQFPQLQVTVQGNFQSAAPYLVRGYGPYVRYEQDRAYSSPRVTKWPTGDEKYYSIGQIMDSRAVAIQQYLISHGIAANRVRTSRGQFTEKRTFTIIFSN